MKTLGLIGGISWVSTVDYYTLINQGVNAKLGGLHFARLILHSFNYADIKKNNDNNDWDKTFEMLSEACLHLKAGGAEAIVLCANTMHLIADRVEKSCGLPVIHIATETAKEVNKKGLKKVGLLGTKFTMELDFFTSKLRAQNIDVVIPGEADRTFVHATIADELGKGIFTEQTRKRYLSIMQELVANGAEGVILGCTEIPMLIKPGDTNIPLFDTTAIHSAAAVAFALGD
jgi:aspartate racemase